MIIKKLFNNFQKEVFRLELLNLYHVAGEWDMFQRFKNGEEIIYKENELFCEEIENLVAQDKSVVRVHVVPEILTDYLKFEIQCGYIAQNKAGAEIYLLERDKFEKLKKLNLKLNDFWMFDNKTVLEFIYDSEGRFLKECLIEDKNKIDKIILLKNDILRISTPLSIWLKKNDKKFHKYT